MTPFELYTKIALKKDVPSYRLRAGDVAVIVEIHPGTESLETGYSLEVFDALGGTLAVVTVRESEIEPLEHNEVLHVRRLDKANI
jgi:hypothetical protein